MNKELLKMPSKITKDTYFKRDTYEVVNKSDIDETVSKEVSRYFELEETTYRNDVIDKMTKNLKSEFIQDSLRKFVDNSYLIKIKQGGVPKEDAEDYTALNKIIRKITKDRPNDFTDVLSKIVDIIKEKDLTKYNSEDVEEVETEVEDDLVEAIENEEKKLDKLTKYINETVKALYNTCSIELKKEYEEHYNKFLKDNKKTIDTKVNNYMAKFKDEEEIRYTKDRRNNIVNLFNYIIDYYIDRITWLDDGKYVTMVTDIKQGTKEYIVTSGTICPDTFKVDISRFKELHRYDTSFTLIIKGE